MLRQQSTMRWLQVSILLVASILFRVPALLNARGINSDAAIVGLQALHILRGEWSWFLWGAGYQSSLDSFLVGVGFALTGPHAVTMMAVPLIGHLVLTWLTFDLLRKRLDPALAFVATLVVVLGSLGTRTVEVYPPRQWAITSVVAAVWLLDGASDARREWIRYTGGTLLSVLALYLDFFTLQFLPGIAVFALACVSDGAAPRRLARKRVGFVIAGLTTGLLLVWLVRSQPEARVFYSFGREASEITGMSLELIPANLTLLWNTCLPALLGYFVLPLDFLWPGWSRWNQALPIRMVQIIGAAFLMLGILSGGLAVLRREAPWPVRRLGVLGCIVALSSLAGFLLSRQPLLNGIAATRYLAPITWMVPFALAPVAYTFGKRFFPYLLAPYLIVAGVVGWLAFAPAIRYLLPIRTAYGMALDEAELGSVLRQRGIEYAAGEYWLAYRLSFLWNEDPVVAPLDRVLDRYQPYQTAFDSNATVALIFRPADGRMFPEPYEQQLKQAGTRYERIQVRDFVVLIVHRVTPEINIVPGDGWSGIEAWGVWADRTESEASWYALSQRPVRLSITMRPLCVSGKQQAITTRVNGLMVFSHQWKDCEAWHGELLVPRHLLQTGWNKIDFQSKFLFPTSEAIGVAPADRRSLAFAITELRVQPLEKRP